MGIKQGILMRLIMVHGWSVTHTETYGELPLTLSTLAKQNNMALDIEHVFLGKYVSFNDEVTIDDISVAFDRALKEIKGNSQAIKPFACITHSTGGPVVRHWINRFYGAKGLAACPIKHLVMLAPANHGSALAALGKQQVSRLKAWFEGVEPGIRILDWLCLGSSGQWSLNKDYLKYQYDKNGFYPFVFAGQGIDTKLYDFLNSYLIEKGSDGVIRVAGANMNYRYCTLVQTDLPTPGKRSKTLQLHPPKGKPLKNSAEVPLGVFGGLSHSGTKMGIMASKANNPDHMLLAGEIIKCFKVNSAIAYNKRKAELKQLTQQQQQEIPKGKKYNISQYCMLVFNIHDEKGVSMKKDDCDVFLLAGKNYAEKLLPEGFFLDRQFNDNSMTLIYYLDAAKMLQIADGSFGIKIIARPFKGFAYYLPAEFRSEGLAIGKILAANETTYFDITLKRRVDRNVFRFQRADEGRKSFKRIKPSGEIL